MKLMVVFWGVSVAMVTTTAALAGSGPMPIDEKPSIVGSGSVALGGYASLSRDSVTRDSMKSSVFGVTVAPLLDVFVADRVSMGGGVALLSFRATNEDSGSRTDANVLVVRPTFRLGWYVPLGERVGFWPIAHVGYGYAHSRSTSTNGSESTSATSEGRNTSIGLDAQIVFHVGDGWFVRAVPAAAYVSSGSAGGVGAPIGLLGGFLLGFGGFV